MLARDSFSKLLAAGLTARVRAAGVRDRRRRHEAHPADRRDAAVRLLRRLVDRWRTSCCSRCCCSSPSARGARRVNTPDPAAVRASFVCMFARCWSADVVVDGRARRRAQPHDTARTRATLLRGLKIRRGTIRAADGTVDRALGQATPRASTRAATRTATLFGHPVGYSYTQTRPDRARGATTTTSSDRRRIDDATIAARPARRQARERRRRPAHDARSRRPSSCAERLLAAAGPTTAARRSRSTRAPARSR